MSRGSRGGISRGRRPRRRSDARRAARGRPPTRSPSGPPASVRALADADDPRMPLRAEVLASGKPASGRLKKAGLYVSVRPLRTPSGEIVALVETALPRDAVASSLARLVRELLLLSLLVAALATL